MTRAEAVAFLAWYEQAKTAAAAPLEVEPASETPSPAQQVQAAIREVVDIFAPVVEVVEVLFNAPPGTGLAVRADKKTGVVERVEKITQSPIALA